MDICCFRRLRPRLDQDDDDVMMTESDATEHHFREPLRIPFATSQHTTTSIMIPSLSS
jgi:hypothetical protein